MSGRLVILPHKRWNVWNQDNREKVLKDERIHREKVEADNEREKKLLQEHNLQLLRGSSEIGEGAAASALEEVVDIEEKPIEPFCLFDLERKQNELLGNEEYLKEKKKKEELQKKRDGVADWGLGEGSVEVSKQRPWYEKVKHDAKSNPYVEIKLEPNAPKEESKSKRTQDPMSKLLYNKDIKVDIKVESKYDKSKDRRRERDEDNSYKRKRGRSPQSEERSSSRKNGSSITSGAERSSEAAPKHNGSSSSSSSGSIGSSSSSTKVDNNIWDDLRLKRLEREAAEKKRTALLLARNDIYGNHRSGTTPNNAYGQQFHPNLARKYY